MVCRICDIFCVAWGAHHLLCMACGVWYLAWNVVCGTWFSIWSVICGIWHGMWLAYSMWNFAWHVLWDMWSGMLCLAYGVQHLTLHVVCGIWHCKFLQHLVWHCICCMACGVSYGIYVVFGIRYGMWCVTFCLAYGLLHVVTFGMACCLYLVCGIWQGML